LRSFDLLTQIDQMAGRLTAIAARLTSIATTIIVSPTPCEVLKRESPFNKEWKRTMLMNTEATPNTKTKITPIFWRFGICSLMRVGMGRAKI
jgi:hypothetical protein